MKDRYFFQINRIKLQDYVQHGVIAPDKYLGNELQKDIQSKRSDFLVFSNGYLEKLDEHQILLEIVLTKNEKEKLQNAGDCYFLSVPLPIVRIKKIYAQDKNVIKHIMTNLLNSEKGFLQEEIFDVFLKNKQFLLEQKQYSTLDDDISSDDFSEKLRVFDKRMGMFCFMKNTNIYYSDERGVISNYSDHYFSALSMFLENKIEENHFRELDILNQNKDFKALLFSGKQIDKEFVESIANTIKDTELKQVFLQILTPNGTRTTLPLLVAYGESGLFYYLVGLVYYFRQINSNKKDNFKLDINFYIPSYEFAELSLLILGIYLGYSNLRSSEKINIKDKVFKTIFGDIVNIKFALDSKLDYITIEAIYNYCFNEKKKGYEFEYLPYPQNKQKGVKRLNNKDFKRWYEITDEKTYFGAQYITIQKKSFEKIIRTKLEKEPEELAEPRYGILLGYASKRFPSILSSVQAGENFQKSCKKEELIKVLIADEFIKKQNVILDLIELDGKL